MKKSCNVFLLMTVLVTSLLLSSGCTCGFDCSSSDDDDGTANPVSMTLRFAGGPLGEFELVNIGVDRIEFVDSDNNIVASRDRFTIDALPVEDADSFAVNLLALDPVEGLRVLSNVEFPPGFITIRIHLVQGDLRVRDDEGLSPDFTVTNNIVSLPGRSFNAGPRDFVVDFRLPRSLQRNTAQELVYVLETDEVLLVNAIETGTITGAIDDELFDQTDACDDKSVATEGNRVYLYQGDVAADALTELQSGADSGAPYNVAVPVLSGINDEWSYTFGFLPVDEDYTLAFTCDAAEDDPEDVDNIVIPQPTGQRVVITELDNNGDTVICDFELESLCTES